MELEIKRVELLGNKSEASMTHAGMTIQWSISVFEKTSFTGDFDIFEQINGYWSKLPMAIQDKIFNVYQRIRTAFDSIWDTSKLTQALYGLVKELYTYHSLGDVRHWVDFHSNLTIPRSVSLDTYVESRDTPGSRERTYLKEDYRWLVVLSISMRAMLPVWGEFIHLTKKDTGTTFKEYYAYKLLAHSSISASEPMERLRVYVEHSLPQDKSKAAAILGGLSSEDFPIWVLGLVVIRRLSVGDVRGIDPNSSLITFIFKYIGQKVKSHDSSFIGLVKEKIAEGSSLEGDASLSKLEGYKVKQELALGDVAAISNWLTDVRGAALKVCPDLDLNLLQTSMASVRALENVQIMPPQITLIQWVVGSALPARAMDRLHKHQVLDAMAIAQACLWHRGHFELAALVSATAQSNQEELQLGGGDSRARIPKDMVETLFLLYPHSRRQSGKQKPVRQPSVASANIDSLSIALSKNDWRITLPGEVVLKLTGNKNARRYSVPHDIKVKLAILVIELATSKFNQGKLA